jgi:putative oxygen-independent coproporphyrinogen III oxidase
MRGTAYISSPQCREPPQLAVEESFEPAFGLYVHWPFCRAKCPYCDFNSHVRPRVEEERWRAALVAEVERIAAEVGRRRLVSIFFGGGTPSLMQPGTVAAVIDHAVARFDVAADLEVTLEANPTSVEAQRFTSYRAAGVNRVSLGVQALADADLRLLGREHTANEALAAVELAMRHFPRWSFDLIYARPGQTVTAWEDELQRALRWVGGHLSAYQLTIEEGTRFHALHQAGLLKTPEEERQAELFELTQGLLSDAGLPGYEISNHARPGEESRHNLVYWRYGDYAGIGPGAHGRLGLGPGRWATRAERVPERWLAAVEQGGSGEVERSPVSPAEQAIEAVMMGLRLSEGVPVRHLEDLARAPLTEVIDPAARQRLEAAGFLVPDTRRLRATAAGRQRLNAVLGMLLR